MKHHDPEFEHDASPRKRPLADPASLIATWFGSGYSPVASGTAGSAVAAVMAWPILQYGGQFGLSMAAILAFAVGIWATHIYCKRIEQHDPSSVVIDEVAGQWVTLVAAPLTPVGFLIGFLLFRFFDIVKPWPANYIDRNVMGAIGVMLDDIVAGVYAGLVMLALGWAGVFDILPTGLALLP